MINRRAASRAGVTLSEVAEMYRMLAMAGLVNQSKAQEIVDAVHLANEVICQYNAIPNEVRAHYFREVGADGVPMQDLAQE